MKNFLNQHISILFVFVVKSVNKIEFNASTNLYIVDEKYYTIKDLYVTNVLSCNIF